ncbi:hypothetical protein PT274_00480 [Leuconostocaceae bacterium ESL0958]|nr:hypothetical protein [Leuconostocaceae bacterium ESL0958]
MEVQVLQSLTDWQEPGPAWQIARVKAGLAAELWLLNPHEDGAYLAAQAGLDPARVYDLYRQCYVSEEANGAGRWLHELGLPNAAQIVLQQDGGPAIVDQGQVLAQIRLFESANQLVQAVSYQNRQGLLTQKAIYLRNGERFAQQLFARGQLQKTTFYHRGQMVVQEYYQERQLCLLLDAAGRAYPSRLGYLNELLAANRAQQDQQLVTTDATLLAGTLPASTILARPQGLADEQGTLAAPIQALLQQQQPALGALWVRAADLPVLAAANRANRPPVALLKE